MRECNWNCGCHGVSLLIVALRRNAIEIVLVLIVAAFIVWRFLFKTATAKGKRGEKEVSSSLSRSLDDTTYRVINDVTLHARNTTTQIDHLVISPYGVFVIETKHMSGWIFGREDQANWTQVLFKRKHRFQNPLQQNRHHLRTIQSLFGVRSDHTHGIVVFTGRSTFKTEVPPGVANGVGQLTELIRMKSVRVFSDHEVLGLIQAITSKRLAPNRETDRLHVRNVNEMNRRRNAKSSTACPRCGSRMVERTNRSSGERFLGCQRYPRCKGVRPAC
jgi:hypothetical protein